MVTRYEQEAYANVARIERSMKKIAVLKEFEVRLLMLEHTTSDMAELHDAKAKLAAEFREVFERD